MDADLREFLFFGLLSVVLVGKIGFHIRGIRSMFGMGYPSTHKATTDAKDGNIGFHTKQGSKAAISIVYPLSSRFWRDTL